MGLEIWIVVLVVASGLSGWAGYLYASRRAPKRAEIEALETELDEARREAETVRADVNAHFEQSAALFGKLAGDYREFLQHFADSAGKLGLSEARARALIEEGVRPLLTHEAVEGSVAVQAEPEQAADPAGADLQAADTTVSDETVQASEEDAAAPPRVADVELNVPQDVPATEAGAGEPDERMDERMDVGGTEEDGDTRRQAGSKS